MNINDFERRLDILFDFIYEGQIHLYYFKRIHNIIDTGSVVSKILHPFITISCDSHLKLAVINFSKLFDKHKDSISIINFLNFLESNGKKIFSENWDNIIQLISESKVVFIEIFPKYERLIKLRDENIAHYDKRELKKFFNESKTEIACEIENGFSEVEAFLNPFCEVLKIGSNFLKELKNDLFAENHELEDLEFLLKNIYKIVDDSKINNRMRTLLLQLKLN